jgi:digalactosyldiacylglycerol synthase
MLIYLNISNDSYLQVLRLSAATQDLPKSIVCNVHGKNPNFLKIGENITFDRESGQPSFSKGAYFLGKMIWAKGYSIEN